jgi:hypothetical protein
LSQRVRGAARGLGVFVAFGLMATASPRRAVAADSFDVGVPVTSPPATGGTESAVVARYWQLGRARPFLGATVEAGVVYLRAKFMAGYGRPHWSWLGVEAAPLSGLGGVGYYNGLAAALPWLTLRAGTRYFYPYSRTLLAPRERYEASYLQLDSGPAGDYVAHEAEATLTAPLGHGSAFGVLSGIRTALVPEGYYLYEESLKVIIEPPYVWRARAGYLLAFGQNGSIRVGAAGDVIGMPGRDAVAVRAGLMASVHLSAKLEAQASFIPVLFSPDSLGLAGSDFGQLGIRYHWATGSDPDPDQITRTID